MMLNESFNIKRTEDSLHAVDKFTGFMSLVESSGSSTKPNNSMGDDCRVTRCKRKASIGHMPPRKRQRGASEPTTEVTVEAVTAKGIQRKTHSNNVDTSEPTKVSQSQKEASAEQQPAAETTRTKRWRRSGCDLSTSSSSPSTSTENNWSPSLSVDTSRANFEAKYMQLGRLGEGGFGSVYAGYRKTDDLPVAIKHIPEENVISQPVVLNGETCMVPVEVLLMQRVAGGPESVGQSAAVSLLDWYILDEEVLLVMERPVPSLDLLTYLDECPMEEDEAKNIMRQLVEATIKIHSEGVFHRDIKSENVLVETESDVPRVRLIDFGCGCFVRERYNRFAGTSAYVPPEFYIQGTYQAGPTTVWQLGALLYEMLNGDKQFNTSQFLLNESRFRMEIRDLMTQDCQNLLRMCLTVDPQKRVTLEQMLLHPWFK